MMRSIGVVRDPDLKYWSGRDAWKCAPEELRDGDGLARMASPVDIKVMTFDSETKLPGDLTRLAIDRASFEWIHLAAAGAYQMMVMMAVAQRVSMALFTNVQAIQQSHFLQYIDRSEDGRPSYASLHELVGDFLSGERAGLECDRFDNRATRRRVSISQTIELLENPFDARNRRNLNVH